MTTAMEDLITSLQVFSEVLENEGCDLEDFDYVEFLTDTVPALAEKVEYETLQMCLRRTQELDPNNATKLSGWYADMGVSIEE